MEEGDRCPQEECLGEMIVEREPCYCGAVPAPCPACENAWLECSDCAWREEEPVSSVLPCPEPLCEGVLAPDLNQAGDGIALSCSICSWRSDAEEQLLALWGEW